MTTLAIVGVVFALFSMPGVVVHEFAHKKACDWIGVPVVDVVYFRFGNPPGYVQHVEPDRYRASFAISVAPFLVNTVVALTAFAGLAWLVHTLEIGSLEAASRGTVVAAGVLWWVGTSVGIHAFPSTGDANTLWTRARGEWRRSPTVIVGLPVVALLYLANLLSRLYLDTLYAIGLLFLAWHAVSEFAV
ncbi:metalloprotease family protein [Halomontanus rarus]|uniref:metalloprotease family protein n=1 Tax=Halomontanus rarus TaxID=3034020 RepID=UPI001A97D90D